MEDTVGVHSWRQCQLCGRARRVAWKILDKDRRSIVGKLTVEWSCDERKKWEGVCQMSS